MNSYPFSALQIGLRHTFPVNLTTAVLDQFLDMTGDCNEIHIDSAAAQQRGLDHRVVWGMLTSAFYSTLVGVHLPGKFGLLSAIQIDFVSPAYPHDKLLVEGEICQRSEAMRAITIRASIRAIERRQIVSKARILVKVHE